MKRYLTILSLMLFGQMSSYAETYCFNPDVSLSEVIQHLEVMLTPKDRVTRSGSSCLDVTVSVSRTPLIYKWLKKKYRVRTPKYAQNSSAQAAEVTKNCRLQVERISKGKTLNDEVSLGNKTRLNRTTRTSSGKSVSSLLLGQGFSGAIRVNDRQVFLTCKSGGSGFYTIQVSLSEESSSLSTVIQLRSGQKQNIGQVVEDLKTREKSLGLPGGIGVKKEKKNFTYDYFLIAQ